MKKRIVKILLSVLVSISMLGHHTLTTADRVTEARGTTIEQRKQIPLDYAGIYHTRTQTDFDRVTKILEDRHGRLIFEVVDGVVLDSDGNGKGLLIDGSKTDGGYYIKYDSERFKKGDRVQSIFMYNPDNNFLDDIIYRADKLIH